MRLSDVLAHIDMLKRIASSGLPVTQHNPVHRARVELGLIRARLDSEEKS